MKLAPTDNFSIEAGKLPTLIGAESNFTFENMNIERGLLFNQTPTVSRGVQANYNSGPIAVSISVNDGYYSNRFNWISGSVAWTIDSANTVSFVGGGNLGTTPYSSFTAPQAQNNGAIFDIIYAYNAAPWSLQPYLQYGRVPTNALLGFMRSSETYGMGLLGTYAFTPSLSLSGRFEYEASADGAAAPNLLYGTEQQSVVGHADADVAAQAVLLPRRGLICRIERCHARPRTRFEPGQHIAGPRIARNRDQFLTLFIWNFYGAIRGAISKSYAMKITFKSERNWPCSISRFSSPASCSSRSARFTRGSANGFRSIS